MLHSYQHMVVTPQIFGLLQENRPDRLAQRLSAVPWDNSGPKKVIVVCRQAMHTDHATQKHEPTCAKT